MHKGTSPNVFILLRHPRCLVASTKFPYEVAGFREKSYFRLPTPEERMLSITLTKQFNVSPKLVYEAWLDSKLHSEMTGGEAECSSKIGGSFTTWDGYISGENINLRENEEIVQAWRTTEFSDTDPDSMLTITLKPLSTGCELTLFHENIPLGQSNYELGWIEHYFEPMAAYFTSLN